MPKIKRTLTRDMPDRSRIVAFVELREAVEGTNRDEEDLSPAFSVTCAIYEPHGTWSGAACQRNGRDWDGGGANHDAILRAFPNLRPIVDLHLSDPDGTPMHAEANGWYFYAASRDDIKTTGRFQKWTPGLGDDWRMRDAGFENDPHGYALHIACRILRVESIPAKITTREQFASFIQDQRERWQCEAQEARELIESLPTGEEN